MSASGLARAPKANASARGALIRVDAGERPDQVTNMIRVQSWLSGGSLSDILIGGPGRDTLIGGPSADVMKGMNGNDQISGRDLTDDTRINCDGGIGTPGSADKANLDKLPKDSPASGCETVGRS
jgi:Ca2+-binding RTX toxin-like protein